MLEAHAGGDLVVTRTTSWQRISGNCKIDVLSASPWSAREIAQSLIQSMGPTDAAPVEAEDEAEDDDIILAHAMSSSTLLISGGAGVTL